MDMHDFYDQDARFYDADYAALGYTADIAFYRDLAVESGGPVLEMGCGTGRILLPIARAGVEIHGLDLSAAMLGELQRKLEAEPDEVRQCVRLSEGDIRSARVPGAFPLVIAPFRVAQHLLEHTDQRAWLRNVARHLAPGGTLVFDVFQPDFVRLIAPSEEQVELERSLADGRRLRRLVRTVPHPALQTSDVHYRWILDGGQAPVDERSASFTFRWYTRGELENLLELEGFEVLDYWGSFARQPFGEGSTDQIIRCRLRAVPT